MLRALATAGVSGVAVANEADDESALPANPGLSRVPLEPAAGALGSPPFGSGALRAFALTAPTVTKALSELHRRACAPSLERIVTVAREATGPDALLAVVVPAARDYGRLATPDERALGRALVRAGADLVVGEGGYAVKEIEQYEGAVIAYSLGTLLRPARRSLASEASSGLLLRVFPSSRRGFGYDITPVTFDDEARPALDHAVDTSHVVIDRTPGPHSLADWVEAAERGPTPELRCDVGTWDPTLTTRGAGLLRGLDDWLRPLTEWIPSAPVDSPLEPFNGGCARGRSAVLLRGVTSLGAYRRAVEIDPGHEPRQSLTVSRVTFADRLSIAYALPTIVCEAASEAHRANASACSRRANRCW